MVGVRGSHARPGETEEGLSQTMGEQMGFNTQEALMAY